MNHGKYVFSQLVEFLPQRVFDRFVAKYDGNKKSTYFLPLPSIAAFSFVDFQSGAC
jgi:hypothetical protein